MELKLSNRKRFFVRVSNNIKEALQDLDISEEIGEGFYRAKAAYKEASFANSYDCALSIEDYIVDDVNTPTFSKLVNNNLF